MSINLVSFVQGVVEKTTCISQNNLLMFAMFNCLEGNETEICKGFEIYRERGAEK